MIKQNPFSIYDFLGYFIPGAAFIYLFLFLKGLINNDALSFFTIIRDFENSKFHGILLLIIGAYIVGHLLSYLSSITVEKYGNWKYGYPSKYLIGLPISGYWKSSDEKKIGKREKIIANFWRFSIGLLLLPFTLLDLIFGSLIGIKKSHENSLDPFLRKAITSKISSLYQSINLAGPDMQDIFNPIHQDFHRIVTHYVFENCKEHQFRMVNYVALYGFLRNLSLIFTLSFWFFFTEVIASINFQNEINWLMIKILGLLMVLSFISFLGFMKFYRRYTLEGLMLVVIDKNL